MTGKSDDPEFEVDQADHTRTLVRAEGPVICYLNSLQPRRKSVFDRAALGLAEEDVVLMNAGSLSKLRRECLLTFMGRLKSAPAAELLLAPASPVGRRAARPSPSTRSWRRQLRWSALTWIAF